MDLPLDRQPPTRTLELLEESKLKVESHNNGQGRLSPQDLGRACVYGAGLSFLATAFGKPLLSSVVAEVGFVVIAWLVVTRRKLPAEEAFMVRRAKAGSLAFPIILALGIQSASSLVLMLVDFLLGGNLSEAMTRVIGSAISPGFLAQLVLLGVVAPLSEELFYRGFGLYCFRDWGQGWAVILPSAIFALYHGPLGVAYAFVLGFSAALLVLKTASLWPAIVLHGAANLCVLGLDAIHSRVHGVFPGLPEWLPCVVVRVAGLVPLLAFRSDVRDLWTRAVKTFRSLRQDELLGQRFKTLFASWSYVVLVVFFALSFTLTAVVILAPDLVPF